MKKGRRAGTMTHDYRRHGTTTLFAALYVASGEVIGECYERHRHDEFLTFLKQLDRQVDQELDLEVIVDNHATHEHPTVEEWLTQHPRVHLHFTPTSSSWVNLVERFFAEIIDKAIRRGIFTSVRELEAAIAHYLATRNKDPHPYVWTAKVATVIKKVARARRSLAFSQDSSVTPH